MSYGWQDTAQALKHLYDRRGDKPEQESVFWRNVRELADIAIEELSVYDTKTIDMFLGSDGVYSIISKRSETSN